MAGKPGTWAKGQKVVKTVDLSDSTTAPGVVIVDTAGNPIVGTGGGAATIADGADVAQGATSDVAWVSGSGTVISLLKKIASAGGSAVSVADGADVAQGTTTDLSSANTVVGLLKAIKAAITGTLTISGSVTGPVTDTQIRATPLPISGTVTATTGGLTDTQLRATPVPVSGTVTATTGGLTDTQLRATPVPVSGTVTASGPLTDTQLRNTAVPVSGPLTDTQIRATALPVSLAAETTKVIGTVRGTDGLGNSLNASGPGFLRTTDEPKQVFYDPFDGTLLDTTARWTASFGLGAAVQPTQVSGTASINAGATSGGWSRLVSQPTFTPPIPAWIGGSAAISLSDGAAPPATGTRFWGFGSPANTPTTGAPVVDGVGFEIASGKMYAVVYANSVRTVIADLSAATGTATQPTDASNHRYIVQVRTDKTYWYIDSLATPVATSNFQSPVVQTLPFTFVSVSGGSATQIDSAGIAVWDTGKNATQIADGASPWRKQTVKAGSAAVATTDNPAVVTVHPASGPTASQPVYDDLNRRLLEEILIEMRTTNALLMQENPYGHLQADTRPDLRLAQ